MASLYSNTFPSYGIGYTLLAYSLNQFRRTCTDNSFETNFFVLHHLAWAIPGIMCSAAASLRFCCYFLLVVTESFTALMTYMV